jgi:hypothetical protein
MMTSFLLIIITVVFLAWFFYISIKDSKSKTNFNDLYFVIPPPPILNKLQSKNQNNCRYCRNILLKNERNCKSCGAENENYNSIIIRGISKPEFPQDTYIKSSLFMTSPYVKNIPFVPKKDRTQI